MNDKELKEQLKKEMLNLCETNSSVMIYMECLMRKYENLQSKIDKAIEYIEKFNEPIEFFDTEELLDVLRDDK